MKLSSENQRMWDLVQVERFLLHDLGLITDDELALLASDGAAVKRLEDYDALQDEMALLRAELENSQFNTAEGNVKIAQLQDQLTMAKAQVAAAFLAAAELVEQLNREGPYQAIGAAKHIKALTPANAERSLQVYAQERVLEEAAWWSEGYHRANGWPSCPKCERLAAATAQLAELRNTKASGVKL